MEWTEDVIEYLKSKDENPSISKNMCLQNMFLRLMEQKTTNTRDVLSESTADVFENKVYTKKVYLGIEADEHKVEKFGNVSIEFVSLSAYEENFDDAHLSDIRVSFKDKSNNWINEYVRNFDDEQVLFLYRAIEEVCTEKNFKENEESLVKYIESALRSVKNAQKKCEDVADFIEYRADKEHRDLTMAEYQTVYTINGRASIDFKAIIHNIESVLESVKNI